MTKLLTDWKVLQLEEMHKLYPQVTEVYDAAKEARRQLADDFLRPLL